VGVVVVADHKRLRASLGEVQQVLGQANAPATVLGGIAHDPKGADLLSGEWGGNLDRTLLIKTAREVAQHLVQGLPPIGNPAPARSSTGPQPAMPTSTGPQPASAPDLAAATLPAPITSATAPRTTFTRVLGARSGRHAQGPAPDRPETPETPENPQTPEDSGWGGAPWQHSPRPAGSPSPPGRG
jgi:hypothetical protein